MGGGTRPPDFRSLGDFGNLLAGDSHIKDEDQQVRFNPVATTWT
jgi:hypothetical protein